MSINTTFKPVEWSESMATGIEAIDKQHRFLVETLQEANEVLPKDADGVILQEVVINLLRYAIMHFETEEKLMQRYGYQDAYPEEAQNHILQHRNFSKKIVAIRDELRVGHEVSPLELLIFLNDWLYDHLLGVDQQYCEYLCKAMKK